MHAKLDSEAALPADGGTHFYRAPHYGLQVTRSMISFGDAQGWVVGPVLYFKDNLAPSSLAPLAATRIVFQAKR